MKVTVCFDNVRVVVPCGDGTLLVRDLMHEAILRYKKATGKSDNALTINSLSSLTGGGLLDPDDRLCDVADDREQIVAHFVYSDVIHAGGDGASSVGTNSPDFFHGDCKDHRFGIDHHPQPSNIKRESTKRLSMHVLSTREPCLTTYSAQSLPRESRRKEPLGQDAKSIYELPNLPPKSSDEGEIREIVIKNEAGPLGLHVVPCYDLSGNDQGLRVEGIEPNGRIAKDGQIDLHDNIIKINGHNLLRMPFSKVQEIFRTCMNEPCLKISVLKHKKSRSEKSVHRCVGDASRGEKAECEENVKRLQGTNYNILQTANTRKIGKMIEIELTKGSNGLGFSVTTRDNPAGGHCPIYIKNILPKGAAVEDGRLKPGDRLLEVNKMEMTGKSQDEVVALLRSIPPGGKVKLLVSRQEEVSTNTSDSQIGVPSIADAADTSRNCQASHRSPIKKSDEEKLDSYAMDKFNFKTIHVSDGDILFAKKNRMILTLDIPVHDSEKAGLGSIQNSISVQQIRFRSKINIQRPKPFHHERGKVMQFLTPFFPNPNKGKKLWEVCKKAQRKTLESRTKTIEGSVQTIEGSVKAIDANPYEIIVAREVRNWFNSSKMIAFFHKNSMTAEDEFNFKVNMKRKNMYGKFYGRRVLQLALLDTVYAPVLQLFRAPSMIVFSPHINITALHKAARKTPQVTLLAGILHGKLLSRNEFLECGKMDLTTARVGLVSVLQNAGGNNLNRQLITNQSALITRLQQIGSTESSYDKND